MGDDRRKRCRGFCATCCLLVLASAPQQALADDVLVSVSTHGLAVDMGGELLAAVDLVLDGAWAPIPQLAVGLETAVLVPVQTSGLDNPTDLALRLTPTLWLRFGDDQGWGFFKLGCGIDSLLLRGSLESALVVVTSMGFAVAPRELWLYFGFEITGELDIVGEVPVRTLGLGGFVGYRF